MQAMGVILLKHRRGSLQENSRFRDFSDFRGRYPAVGGKASSLNAFLRGRSARQAVAAVSWGKPRDLYRPIRES